MPYVIVCQGLARAGLECPLVGQLLKKYDPEDCDGQGSCDWTDKPEDAMKFHTIAEAMICWNQQSKTRPLRFDGKPNKPLTAFTIEITDLDTLHPELEARRTPGQDCG